MARQSRPIALEAGERRELERLLRSPREPTGLVRRAHAVLLMADRVLGVEIARGTGYTPVQIRRLRRRFAEERIASLDDRPRSGRPKKLSPRNIAQVVAWTLKPPPPGLTHWNARELAKRPDPSATMVHRIWEVHGLKPHRVETFKLTTDPEAEERIRDIVGLYLNPPDNAAVLCLDEKTQIQALSRTQPLLPLQPGRPARHTHDYRRNGISNLFASLELAQGRVVGECRPQHTAADSLAFLKMIMRRYPGEHHVILDNSSTQKTPDIQAWLARHPRVHFHFTPTGAAWLNLIEVWFRVLTRKSIRRGSHDSVRELIRHIWAYTEDWNVHPVPVVWSKSAEEIVEKAIRH